MIPDELEDLGDNFPSGYDAEDEAWASMQMLTCAIVVTLVVAAGLIVWGVGLYRGWW